MAGCNTCPRLSPHLENVFSMNSRVQNDSSLRQLLQGGGVHAGVVPGDVVEAKVVGKQHQKIWLPCHMVDKGKEKKEEHGT